MRDYANEKYADALDNDLATLQLQLLKARDRLAFAKYKGIDTTPTFRMSVGGLRLRAPW